MPRKDRHTAITQFFIHTPDKGEEYGTVLHLSLFGEYCPEKSLQGYDLFYLITHPQYYCIKQIIQQGKIREIIPMITPATVAINNHRK